LAELELIGKGRTKRDTNWGGFGVQEDIPMSTPSFLADEMSSILASRPRRNRLMEEALNVAERPLQLLNPFFQVHHENINSAMNWKTIANKILSEDRHFCHIYQPF